MKTEISIEFFPPQTPEGVDKLRTVRAELAKLKPEFFSVTYGAGGSTRERTFAVVKEIAAAGGGRGGGRPNMAQAGMPDAAALDKAIEAADEIIETQATA